MQRFSLSSFVSPSFFVSCALVGSLAPPAAAQTSTAHTGFTLTDELNVTFGSAFASFADGRYVGFDGTTVGLYAPDGALLQTYGTFNPPVFASFVELNPAETFAYFGESLFGDVYALDLAAGTYAALANLNFNFDLALDVDPGFAYVSAALSGFGNGNDLVRLDLSSGATVPVAHVAGPSGPVAVSPAGDLYYVTQSETFPPPPAASDIVFFTAAQLNSGQLLADADASLFSAGLEGSSSLLIDGVSGYVFVAETPFALSGRVLQIGPDGSLFAVVAESIDYISGLELFPAAGSAILAPFQPAGARLSYAFTEFGGAQTQRVVVEPLRPEASFSGPAHGNAGLATLSFDNAFPGGAISIMLAQAADLEDPEVVLELGWGAPVHLALDPNNLIRRSQNVTVDASGSLSIQYQQPPLLTGQWLFQAIVYDDAGNPVATSTHVIND